MLEQSVPDELQSAERTHAGIVLEKAQPMERTANRAVSEGLYPVGDTACSIKGK